jgi:hypothetical protein
LEPVSGQHSLIDGHDTCGLSGNCITFTMAFVNPVVFQLLVPKVTVVASE